MVAVVSDAGPLIHLAQIRKVHLLKELFGTVLLSEKVKIEVFDEGIRHGYSDAETIGKALADGWLRVGPFPKRLMMPAVKMSEGENVSLPDAETLLLAVDKQANLLVDDKPLSDLAKMYGLKVWNVWTLLLECLKKDYIALVEIKDAIDALGKMKFSLNAEQTKAILDSANTIEKRKKQLS